VIPWVRLEALIEPDYPTAYKCRRPYPLPTVLQIHCMQGYKLSVPAMEDAQNEIASIRLFAGLSLDKTFPDHSKFIQCWNNMPCHPDLR